MSVKHVVLAVALTSLLAACGAKPTQAPLPGDGTYSNSVNPQDASTTVNSQGTDPASSYGASGTSPTPAGMPSAAPNASGPAGPGSYTFKGVVTDKASGNPIVGAKISIGSSTMVSGQDGSFEFDNVTDVKIFADVNQTGYDPVSHTEIDFSAASPTANKAFSLAPSGSGGTSSGGTAAPSTGLQEKGSFGSAKFKSIASMAVSGNAVYVLGIVKGFFLSHNEIISYDTSTGEELKTMTKVGLFSYLPKDVSVLQATGSQVIASNGSSAYAFGPDGKFLRKTAAMSSAPQTTVHDTTRHLTYTLKSGTTLTVKPDGGTAADIPLTTISNGTQIALDGDGNIFILDATGIGVHEFVFQPAS